MTTKGRNAPNPKSKSTDTVGDVAENEAAPVSDTSPATNEATSAPAEASGDTAAAPPAPPVAEASKPVEEQPAKKPVVKRKRVDPADDPTAGITGVPVDYVPTPAVP